MEYLGFYSILFLPEDIYDRYALFFVLFVVIYLVKNFKIKKLSYIGLFLVLVTGFVLNWEFFKMRDLQYTQAYDIKDKTGMISSIYFVDTFAFYEESMKHKDYVGIRTDYTLGTEYKCYVQNYVLEDETSQIYKITSGFEDLSEKVVENPHMYNRHKKDGIKNIKKHQDELIHNQRYFSFLYDLVGKQAYVGAFCDEDVSF